MTQAPRLVLSWLRGIVAASYWFRFYNIEAKKFVHAVEHATTPEQLAPLATALAPLTAVAEGLERFVSSKGTKLNASFNAYLGVARSFHSAATKLVREAKAGGQTMPDSALLIGAYTTWSSSRMRSTRSRTPAA